MAFIEPNARWFEIPAKVKEHPIISQWKSDFKGKLFEVYTTVAGRRSFKTELAKRWAVKECLSNDNHTYYCGAPTRIQAKKLFWRDIKQLCEQPEIKNFVKNISESELSIEFRNGTTIQVIGLKEFKRVQGDRCHGLVVTEFQDCDPAVYNESFEPMLNDTGGWAILEGRPLGKNHLHDFYLRGINHEPGFSSYHWSAEDILSVEQIIRAKKNLALQDYRREYLASFDTEYGNPYYAFSSLNLKEYKPDKERAFILTCDFNATEKPMSWVLGQRIIENTKDVTYWFKTFSFPYTNTLTMCGIVDDYLRGNYPNAIDLYGDYRSGKAQQSNSSFTDWEIITNFFTNKVKLNHNYRACNSIRDSIGATNAQLCNALSERKQFATKDCQALIADWEKCSWKANSRELDESDDLRGHCCRAVDYYNDVEHNLKGTGQGFQV